MFLILYVVLMVNMQSADFSHDNLIRMLAQHQRRSSEAQLIGEVRVADEENASIRVSKQIIHADGVRDFNAYKKYYLQKMCDFVLVYTLLPQVLVTVLVSYLDLSWKHELYAMHNNPVICISYGSQGFVHSVSKNQDFRPQAGEKEWLNVVWSSDTGREIGDHQSVLHAKILPPALRRLPQELIDYAISPDQRKMALCKWLSVELWSIKNHHLISKESTTYQQRFLRHRGKPFSAVTFSPCNNYLFVGDLEGIVSVLDIVRRVSIYAFYHTDSVTALTCSPVGDELLVGLSNGSVVVWRGESFSFLSTLRRHLLLSQEQTLASTKASVFTLSSASSYSCGLLPWCRATFLSCFSR